MCLVNKIIQGDALEVLKTLESESVNCVITSPPYWALRDYGVDGQLGLEPTFQEYITKLCDIFDEVKRVLKKSGTCWVNMGDSYIGSGKAGGNEEYKKHHMEFGKLSKHKERFGMPTTNQSLSDKCLCQIPSRFAIEMTNRGWILRNEIIWFKPNCMPSSVKDRFTVDYEPVFFFSKSKKYWFETQYEKNQEVSIKRAEYKWDCDRANNRTGVHTEKMGDRFVNSLGRNKRCVWKIATQPFKEAHFATFPEKLIEPMVKAGCPVGGIVLDPFFGAGTTGVVAKKLGRNYLGIELNPEYIKIANKRLNSIPTPMF